MARKTREEKTIENAKAIIDSNSVDIQEYQNLLKEYQKLNKRFNKMIHMNDAVGKSIIVNNDKLKEDVDFTIKTAKEKILHNVSEHRKTKESIEGLKLEYESIIKSLQKEIENLKKSSIKLDENYNESTKISKVLEKEISNQKLRSSNLSLGKFTIDNFEKLKRDIQSIGSLENVIKAIHKFLQTKFTKSENIVLEDVDTLYIVFHNASVENVYNKLNSMELHRKLGSIKITFSIGLTQYKENDTTDDIIHRCTLANSRASIEENNVSIEINV
jgi:uncharacterized transporter YbjL